LQSHTGAVFGRGFILNGIFNDDSDSGAVAFRLKTNDAAVDRRSHTMSNRILNQRLHDQGRHETRFAVWIDVPLNLQSRAKPYSFDIEVALRESHLFNQRNPFLGTKPQRPSEKIR